MSKKLIAGNWKMNGDSASNQALLEQIAKGLVGLNAHAAVCVPAIYLAQVQALCANTEIAVGAQDMSQHNSGAYTGEISANMLKELNVHYAIVGHSERRQYHFESDQTVAAKAKQALANGITPIVCIGETLAERQAGQTQEVVRRQLSVVIHELAHCAGEIVLAYEPVWAIGTGLTATPEQAQEVHQFLREYIKFLGSDLAQELPILYGGSVKVSNAEALFQMPDIDGGLIGGASLDAVEFLHIYRILVSIADRKV